MQASDSAGRKSLRITHVPGEFDIDGREVIGLRVLGVARRFAGLGGLLGGVLVGFGKLFACAKAANVMAGKKDSREYECPQSELDFDQVRLEGVHHSQWPAQNMAAIVHAPIATTP